MVEESDRARRDWRNAERIKRLSHELIQIGPWGLGLDGVLAWIAVAGTVFSLERAGLLLYESVKAKAAPWTLTRMAAQTAVNTAMGESVC
jgi:hypothetical protein